MSRSEMRSSQQQRAMRSNPADNAHPPMASPAASRRSSCDRCRQKRMKCENQGPGMPCFACSEFKYLCSFVPTSPPDSSHTDPASLFRAPATSVPLPDPSLSATTSLFYSGRDGREPTGLRTSLSGAYCYAHGSSSRTTSVPTSMGPPPSEAGPSSRRGKRPTPPNGRSPANSDSSARPDLSCDTTSMVDPSSSPGTSSRPNSPRSDYWEVVLAPSPENSEYPEWSP
ncbi:hypothetical protein GY45DRAFT_1332943 [Cubamyces sp. BRFM 1775]|nr:hypothetical protein GY45DRAFT_1332943 [Cubamyces sp. BRFM 1775]